MLWELTLTATRLRTTIGNVPPLLEAAAALQRLSLNAESANDLDRRLAQLRDIQSTLPAGIELAPDGPYLFTNVPTVTTWLGVPIGTPPLVAMCRCGMSASKPFCDGTHASAGFTDHKEDNRVPDRRDTYPSVQATILDNRGICQHSGFCTDRLRSVFHTDGDPFVTASGGRMDEVIRAVRACPSGALSYAFDGVEERGDVDHHDTRSASVEVSKDGPYRVRGGLPLRDADGLDVARNSGASREHYALCRCGHSLNKPFCSGMHWYVDFKDPLPDSGREPTVFEWVGGLPALTRMTRIFYEKYVPEEPLLAPLFANMSPDHPERVAKWLGEVFGGPKAYSGEYGGYERMLSQHIGREITEDRRAKWVELLGKSATDAGLPNDPEFRSIFSSYIEWGSRLAVENSSVGATPPPHMPMPHWDWHTSAGAPGSRISALDHAQLAEEIPVVMPGPDEPVSFSTHIKPLIRAVDQASMKWAFDLYSYIDVAAKADEIYGRLSAGSMPPDGAWSAEKVEIFRRWIDTGKLQ
jgi:CDGSH-type Zn-finger protein/truncated hemoglobin YjbI/ferredoxin